jgi:hypothetical protein
LFVEATGIPVALFALTGLTGVAAAVMAPRDSRARIPLLLGAPALIVALQFMALAAGKPGEYGRFALLPATALCLCGTWGCCTLKNRLTQSLLLGTMIAFTGLFAGNYVCHFIDDCGPRTSRTALAEKLDALNRSGDAPSLALIAEPAPYVMPPVNLWRWRLELLPRGKPPLESTHALGSAVFLRAVDSPTDEPHPGFRPLSGPDGFTNHVWPARISWAAKPFEILVAERPSASASVDLVAPAASAPSPAPERP